MNDLKFALRQLRKSPVFTAVAVLTLAFGIAANSVPGSLVSRCGYCQGFVDGDPGTFAVEPQDFRSVQNFDAHQIVAFAIVEEDPIVDLGSCYLAALFGQVNVGRIHFGIVSDSHTLSSKIKRQHRDYNKAVRFFSYDRHDLFGAIIFSLCPDIADSSETQFSLRAPGLAVRAGPRLQPPAESCRVRSYVAEHDR